MESPFEMESAFKKNMFLKMDFKEIYNSTNSISFYLIPKCPSILRHAAAGKRPSLKIKTSLKKLFILFKFRAKLVNMDITISQQPRLDLNFSTG